MALDRPIAVLGPFRGGTSANTGVLHHLGVFVGDKFANPESLYCTWEADWLLKIFTGSFYQDKRWRLAHGHHKLVPMLRKWAENARYRAEQDMCCGYGGKHPLMCKFVDQVVEAWTNEQGEPPILVSVQRTPEDVARSWRQGLSWKGGRWWSRADYIKVTNDLISSRDESLKRHEHISVDFNDLREDPKETITWLANEIGLPLTHLSDAIASIEPIERWKTARLD